MRLLMLLWLVLMATVAVCDDVIETTIQRSSANDGWEVTYQLPKPVSQVYFYRPGRLPRDQWKLVQANLSIKKEADGWQSVRSDDDQVFDRFSIRFSSDYRHTPKDYELNFRFTDGSVILYTGHLMLGLDRDTKTPHKITLIPETDAHVIVDGRVHQKKYSWTEENLQGSYVYFGHIKPVKSARMLGILDPGLPEWIRQRLNQDLPKLFDFYTEKTALELDFIPVIYFSFQPSDTPGTQYSGGTLPGLIQFSMRGNDWQQQSEDNLIGMLHFLAHEAAHLWNSQMIENASGHNSSWIHEGSADAFAVRALRHMEIFNDKDVLWEHEKYLNACIDRLNGHALMNFDGHGNFNAFYNCGSTIALLTERALQNKNASADIFTFWASIMQRVNTLELPLSVMQYIKSLLSLTGDQQAAIHTLTLLEEPQADPVGFFTQMFQGVGLKMIAVEQHPRMARKAAEKAFAHLMQLDCQGQRSYHRAGEYFQVSQGLTCAHLKEGMKISSIAGFTTADQGHQLHQAVMAQCAQSQQVELSSKDGEKIKISCNSELPAQRAWLSFAKT